MSQSASGLTCDFGNCGSLGLRLRVGNCACEGLPLVPALSTARQDARHTIAAAGVSYRFLCHCVLPSGGLPSESGSLGLSQATQCTCEAGI